MHTITVGNDFRLIVHTMQSTGLEVNDFSLAEVEDLAIYMTRQGRTKVLQSFALDEEGKAIIYVNAADVSVGVYGIEITGTWNGARLRAQKVCAFEMVGNGGDSGVLYDYAVDIVLAVNSSSSDVIITNAIDEHNNDVMAHPSLQTAIGALGKVDDVRVDGVSIVTGKTAQIDSSAFGKVDDVRVNRMSVMSGKVAEIVMPTRVSELENDEDYTSGDEVEEMISAASIHSASGTIDGGVGVPSVDITKVGNTLNFAFHNIKGKTGDEGRQGAQGDSFQPIEDVSGLVLAHVLGEDATKAMSQKGVTDNFAKVFPCYVDGPATDENKKHSTANWRLQWNSLVARDRIVASAAEGYSMQLLIIDGSRVLRNVTGGYVSSFDELILPTDGANGDGQEVCARIIIKRDDGTVMTAAMMSNITYHCYNDVSEVGNLADRIGALERESATIENLSSQVAQIKERVSVWESLPAAESRVYSDRYRWQFNGCQPGDRVVIDFPEEDYKLYAFTMVGSSLGRYLIPADGSERMAYVLESDGSDVVVRVLCAKVSGDPVTSADAADIRARCSVKMEREDEGASANIAQMIADVEAEKDGHISILYIGNSLTQDGVSYLPFLLKEIAPNLKIKIYMWYNGGYTLARQYESFVNDTPCEIFSVCESGYQWTNYNNSVTMSEILSNYDFDVVVLQEYMNYQLEFDVTHINNCLNYIRAHHDKPYKVAALLHPPLRSDIEAVYPRTVEANLDILKMTEAESVIATGTSVMFAMETALDELGDMGHLSPDGTHTQEGLPCLLQTYVHALWLFRLLGLPYGVVNSQTRITTDVYRAIKVPGPNLGSGVITGTDEQHQIAQLCAIKADKVARAIEEEANRYLFVI